MINLENLIREIQQEEWAKQAAVGDEFWGRVMDWIERNVLYDFLVQVTHQIDEIVEIDPDLSEQQILEKAARYMVRFLVAGSASVRIYDPQTSQMLSYGSYPSKEKTRETRVSLDWSVAGEVVKTRMPYLVPNILNERLYKNKNVVTETGFHSMMAVPLEIPSFSPRERETMGVIQIYFPEENRTFTPLEVKMAGLMSKRLSFVIARKRILDLYRTNEKKEAIVQHIFRTLGSRGGVKMQEIFNQVIPEIADMIDLQSCALFSVTQDLRRIVLVAGYPQSGGYHSIGKWFPVGAEPAFELLVNLRDYTGDGVSEIMTPSYLLVVDPQRSSVISDQMKRFAELHNINSILYIPLKVGGETSHIMTFDALEHRKRYRDDEIEVLVFLGRELMKAQRMEWLDDALHDFKNPAIATAGFARRLKELVEKEPEAFEERVRTYVDIILEETSRLQELALSLYEVGEEQVVDLGEVLRRRFEINREAIKEQLKQNIELKEGPFEENLMVRCYTMHLERIFDNLFNNATKAIPLRGGTLAIRTLAQNEWACAEITNTGRISEEERLKLLQGEGSGRGLYITHRIVRMLKGRLEVRREKDSTTFAVCLPRVEEQRL
jgi:signal transduction histidine kinase